MRVARILSFSQHNGKLGLQWLKQGHYSVILIYVNN